MTDFLKEFVGKYIRQEESSISGYKVTADRWNELWNLSIGASDHNTKAAEDIVAFLKSNFGTGLVAGENINFTGGADGQVILNASSTIAATDITAREDLAVLRGEFDPVKAFADANETNAITLQQAAISEQTPAEGEVLTYSEEEEKYIPKKLYLTEAEIFRVAPEDATTFSAFYVTTSINSWGMPKAYIPPNITELPTNGFFDCRAVNEIVFENPELVTTIPQGFCRSASNLVKVTPEVFKRVSTVVSSAFEGSGISGEISFGANLTSLGNNAFYNCKNITALDFSQVTGAYSLGRICFGGCSGLVNVKLYGTPTLVSEQTFSSCANLETIEFPPGTVITGVNHLHNCAKLKKITLGPDCTIAASNGLSGYSAALEEIVIAGVLTYSASYPLGYIFGATWKLTLTGNTNLGVSTTVRLIYDGEAYKPATIEYPDGYLFDGMAMYLMYEWFTVDYFNAFAAKAGPAQGLGKTVYIKTALGSALSSAQKKVLTDKGYTLNTSTA